MWSKGKAPIPLYASHIEAGNAGETEVHTSAGYETKDMGNEELRIVTTDNSIIITGKVALQCVSLSQEIYQHLLSDSRPHLVYPACRKRQCYRPCRYLV